MNTLNFFGKRADRKVSSIRSAKILNLLKVEHRVIKDVKK